ncbi:MAG: flavodoxin-like domain-containing protein [Bacteroidetes bacterium]|nr:flavodoxin-like domain-containing protein [Bacteroidota bacterium]
MKTLVIYDSNYGNTRLIARAIAVSMGNDTVLRSTENLIESDLKEADLLIAGSPIIGWRPTQKLASLLDDLPANALAGKKVAAFDTRVRLFIHGNAAKRIAKTLESKGGDLVLPPMGFDVKGKEGPLFEGEIERAGEWARELKKAV